MRWFSLPLAIALGASACEARPDSAFTYDRVILLNSSAPGAVDSFVPLRPLWDGARVRAVKEVLAGSKWKVAYQGGSPLGMNSDRMMVFAITPDRGVFYIMPSHPDRLAGSNVQLVPASAQVCRLTVEWKRLGPGPVLPRLGDITFPDTTCAHPAEVIGAIPRMAGDRQDFPLKAAKPFGSGSTALVFAIDGSGFYRPDAALRAHLARNRDDLAMMIPLNGLAGTELAYARSSKGKAFLVMELPGEPYICVIDGLGWSQIADPMATLPADRQCRDMRSLIEPTPPPIGAISTGAVELPDR